MEIRTHYLDQIKKAFVTSKVVVLLGPRQCGKTTLARQYFKKQKYTNENYFDLENPYDLARLSEPMLALENLKGLVIIDEIQRSEDLFPVLRVLSDREDQPCKFLLTGSASRELLKQSSESLAGRVKVNEATPFSRYENCFIDEKRPRGGLPLSNLAPTEEESRNWRNN